MIEIPELKTLLLNNFAAIYLLNNFVPIYLTNATKRI